MAAPNYGNDLFVLHGIWDTLLGTVNIIVGNHLLEPGDGIAGSGRTMSLPAGTTILAIVAAVELAATGGGATTLDIQGTTTGTFQGGAGATAVAAFAAVGNGVPLLGGSAYVATLDTAQLTIAGAAATAGRIHYYFLCTNGWV